MCSGAASTVWTTKDHFDYLLSRYSNPPEDPEVLHVAGLVDRTGKAAIFYCRPAMGYVDTPDEGDGVLRVRGPGGEVTDYPFSVQFGVTGSLDSSASLSPFVLTIPAPSMTSTLEVRWGSDILHSFNLGQGSLETAIRWIPEHGFRKQPDQRRRVLLSKVEAFERMLSQGDTRAAANKLRNDIRKHVDAWVLDSYEVESPNYFLKHDVLQVIEDLLDELERPDSCRQRGRGRR
jgi:hypothetical protein